MSQQMSQKTLHQKLFDLQSEVGAIAKDSKNPFFKSKYFDVNGLLAHLQPLLKKHRLLLLQPIIGGSVMSRIHDVDSAESVASSMQLPTISDPQKMGSAITYYRRYTLQSLLALQAEDDDGNVASKATKVKPTLKPDTDKWQIAVHSLAGGAVTLDFVKGNYTISPDDLKRLEVEFQQVGGEV